MEGPPPVARAPGAGLRDLFPTLGREDNGRRLVYLDTASTSLRPAAVVDAVSDFYLWHNASAHRGLYGMAEEATAIYEGARARAAAWLGAPDPDGVVLTRNATAAFNLLARGLERRLEPGDEVVLTEMEHHSNLVPWMQLASRRGVVVRHVPFGPDGTLDLAAARALVGPRTRIVSLALVSNVLGTVNPVGEVVDLARKVGALVIVDAVQAAGHLPLSFGDLGADFVVVSAHKCYGPLGLGVLVGRRAALEGVEPLEGGGQMIDRVLLDRIELAPVPQRFEAGTADAAAAAGFVPAVDLLESLGIAAIRAHEVGVVAYALDRLAALGGLEIVGPASAEARGGLVSFHDRQIHPHDMATLLAERNVAVRAGHHCAQPLHARLGLAATVRASFGLYSTRDDVDALVDAVVFARRFMGR
jgi:cysteine desulfurase/selenocysteine lyase